MKECVLVVGIIFLIAFALFLLLVMNEFKKERKKKDKLYQILGINKKDIKSDHKFLVVLGLNVPVKTKCTLIQHKDHLFIVLPNINYKISKEQLIGASMFDNDGLMEIKSETLIGHMLNRSYYGKETEAILDELRPASKLVKFKRNFMVIGYNSSEGQVEAIVLAPETDKDNYFIKMAVAIFNMTYQTKPEAINSDAVNPEAFSTKTVEL